MPLPAYETLDELVDVYIKRSCRDCKNRDRVKKFYNDEESFDVLMNRIIMKDGERFEKFISSIDVDPTDTTYMSVSTSRFLDPWRSLFVVLDIAQNEGEEVPPFDTLTRTHPSRTIMYHGWTFSWVHGENTLISIFNRSNELVYRF